MEELKNKYCIGTKIVFRSYTTDDPINNFVGIVTGYKNQSDYNALFPEVHKKDGVLVQIVCAEADPQLELPSFLIDNDAFVMESEIIKVM